MSFTRPPTPMPKYNDCSSPELHSEILTKRREETKPHIQYVYVNSSNGYLDREISILKNRIKYLENELEELKVIIKENK